MLTFNRAASMLSRAHLITPDAAARYVPRLLEFDPRVAAHSHPFELVSRLAQRPVAMDDDDDAPRKPVRPTAYAPRYIGEPDAVAESGWSLKSGVGLMCIDTPLVDKGFGVCGVWFHGYDTIEAAIREMDADARVKAIFIKWDCPGGVVAPGLYDLTTFLQSRGAVAGAKPMWSYADVMCSGAYWLGSQSSHVACHEAAFVGSIGAVYTHYSLAGMYERNGVVITPIQFGAHKTDGADFKLLDDAARADLQAEIDQIGEDFVATVAAGRGARFTAEQARATEARVYVGRHSDKSRDALALGLVDAVLPEKDAFAALLADVSASSVPALAGKPAAPAASTPGKSGTTTETDMKRAARIAAVMAGKTSAKTSDEKLDEIRKILDEADEDTEAEGEGDDAGEDEEEEAPAEARTATTSSATTAATAARPDAETVLAILDLPEARGREAQARVLAGTPGMTLATAKGILAAGPKPTRLANVVHDPKLSADGGEDKRTESQKAAQTAIALSGIKLATA